MSRSQITGVVSSSIKLNTASYSNPVTVTSTARVLTTGAAISAVTAWTVDNYGHVYSGRNIGIVLSAGGLVTNAAPGVLYGYDGGVAIKGAAGTVVNSGLIQAYNAGVYLGNGGSVSNQAGGRIISGVYAGIYGAYGGVPITVVNSGKISGLRFGVVFRHGGSVTNNAGGTIISLSDTAVYAAGRSIDTISNAGVITGYNVGVYLGVLGGTLTNAAGASIVGTYKVGVRASGPSTVINAGTITGAQKAIYFENAGGNRLVVTPGAVFNGEVDAIAGASANVIELASSAAAGTLAGLGSEYVGFETVTIDSGADWTVAGASAGFSGVTIAGFNSSDTLDLTDVAFTAGDVATIGSTDLLTVSNAGGTALATVQLSGSFVGVRLLVSGDGVGGIEISERAKAKSRLGGSYGNGVILTNTAYTNPVTVTSTGTISNGGNGISAASTWTVDNYGSVSGGTAAGIDLTAGGAVANAASGVISGGNYGVLLGGPGTVTNAGTVTGGNEAVNFKGGGTNRLIVDAGAVFNGTVQAAAGSSNVIELASSSSAGTLSGLGSEYLGFQTVTIDQGASWTVAGAARGFAGVTIGGFGSDDTLDLTNIAYAAGETAVLGASDVLSVSNRGGTVLTTIQLSGSFFGDKFAVASDGAGGIDITETATVLSQITGTYVSGVVLNSAAYSNPVTVGSAGTVSNNGNALSAAAAWTIDNYGMVNSRTGDGIYLGSGGSVTNAAKGTVGGGIYGIFLGGSGTVANAGTIKDGKDAVRFSGTGANRLIVEAGAVFDGAVVANPKGANVIELASSAGAGRLSGLGSKYLGFQTVTIDQGAAWTIAGTAGGFAGVAIGGLGSNDTLDLTDVAFAYGERAWVGVSDVLTVANQGGAVLATLQLEGNFVGDRFTVASDGASGIDITESAITAPLALITGTYSGGIALSSGYASPVTVAKTGVVFGNNNGMYASSSWTVDNHGSVAGKRGAGIYLASGGTVTNASGGTISGGSFGVVLAGSGTVVDAGSITGTEDSVYFKGTGANTLVIDPGAVFDGTVRAASGGANVIDLASSAGIGTLSGLGSEYVGFQTVSIDGGARWTVTGTAADFAGVTISGFHRRDFLDLTDIPSLLHERARVSANDVLTVTNAEGLVLATIQLSGNFTGVKFLVGSDRNGGIRIFEWNRPFTDVLGGSHPNGVALTSSLYTDPVTLTRSGTISSSGYGLSAETFWTVDNQGSISGASGAGIDLAAGGAVTNTARAAIGGSTYGVILGGPGTVVNGGTITGGKDAISFKGAGANRLVIDPRAVFYGGITAVSSGLNVIELASTAHAGTLTGLGSEYVGFQSVAIDPGAIWTIKGKEFGFAGVTIGGFGNKDVLDLTDVAFAKGETATVSASDVLTVTNRKGAVLTSVQLSGSFAGVRFRVFSDGNGGTDLEEAVTKKATVATAAKTGVTLSAAGASAASQADLLGQFVAAGFDAATRGIGSALSAYAPASAPSATLAVHPL